LKVRRLLREIDSRVGGRPALAGLTTSEVKKLVFVMTTKAYSCVTPHDARSAAQDNLGYLVFSLQTGALRITQQEAERPGCVAL